MQLEFLWRDKSSFEAELEALAGHPIDVTVTDNSSNIMTYRGARTGSIAQLRIHRMFLLADSEVIRALCTWLTKRRTTRSSAVLDTFIKENEYLIRSAEPRNVRVTTRGRHFDLQRLYDTVNGVHFQTSVDAPITWGKMPTIRARRSIRLGSYTPEDHLIRIHPLLDQAFVPEYFVRYIVFHEMLHAYLGVETAPSGRRRVHTPEFKRIERAYPDFTKATAWHDDPKNLRRLLRSA